MYGGATAVGAFATKLTRASNVHPIIALAGNGIAYVETLLDTSAGDAIVDYRNGPNALIADIKPPSRHRARGKIFFLQVLPPSLNSEMCVSNLSCHKNIQLYIVR